MAPLSALLSIRSHLCSQVSIQPTIFVLSALKLLLAIIYVSASAFKVPFFSFDKPASAPTPLTYKPYHHPQFESDGKKYSAVNGIYPKGCIWRDIEDTATKEQSYEYWDDTTRDWTDTQPAACLAHRIKSDEYTFPNGTPRSEVNCTDSYCEYKNLWANNGRWYVLVDGPNHVAGWRMSRNQPMNSIHVSDAQQFSDNV